MMKEKLSIFLFILIIVNLSIVGYLWHQNYLLKKDKLVVEGKFWQSEINLISQIKTLKETVRSFEADLSETEFELSETKTERDDFKLNYNLERERMDFFASQLGDIEGTVGTLEKLSQTDPELLKKYSKVYFLSENYVPESFIKIDSDHTYNPDKDYFIYSKIWNFLGEMMADMESKNIDIKIISAYRSFGEQAELKASYLMVYGSGANSFSSDQGYSEHQLGTAVDFTTSEIRASYTGFEKTETYQWLLENAYKYGFILSYPEDNQYYQFEPWHWRFVGRDLADKLHQEGKNFYDLDQREIDQYLISFFD